jgi:hypothetical protein
MVFSRSAQLFDCRTLRLSESELGVQGIPALSENLVNLQR